MMIAETVEAITPSMTTTATPWVGGQLPSPWASPAGQAGLPAGNISTFAQTLDEARTTAASKIPSSTSVSSVQVSTEFFEERGLSKKLGFSAIETMGSRLSKADAEMYRSVENLNNLDPTSPNLQAELLSVSLLSTKASISTTLAMKFSSKVSENINTLLKTN
jgi:hypothetical protein